MPFIGMGISVRSGLWKRTWAKSTPLHRIASGFAEFASTYYLQPEQPHERRASHCTTKALDPFAPVKGHVSSTGCIPHFSLSIAPAGCIVELRSIPDPSQCISIHTPHLGQVSCPNSPQRVLSSYPCTMEVPMTRLKSISTSSAIIYDAVNKSVCSILMSHTKTRVRSATSMVIRTTVRSLPVTDWRPQFVLLRRLCHNM